MIAIILFLIVLAVITVFSVQNAMPVAITFFFWKFEASLAIVIFLSFLTGCLLAGLIVLSRRIRSSMKKEEGKQSGTDVKSKRHNQV